MKLNKKMIWSLMAAAAFIIVVVVLVVLLTSASGPGGTPTPTYTASPGPTATGSVGPLPTDTCEIYFDKASYVIENGETFNVTVMISNVDYLVTGQFDLLYDKDILNVAEVSSDGTIYDTYTRTAYGNPATGCGWQSIEPVDSNGIDIGYGNAMSNSGCFRILWQNDWSQKTSSEGDCAGGDGTGQCGDGWIIVVTFRAVSPGTSEIGFWKPGNAAHPMLVHQIVNWDLYYNYSYTGNEHLMWGPNVQVTVQ